MIDKFLNVNHRQLLKKLLATQFVPVKRTIWNESFNISYKIKKDELRNNLFLITKQNIHTSKTWKQQDPYTVLGVSRNATANEIKKQFRILAKKYHPDINPSPDAKQKMANITAAYELLSDPQKKEFYDKTGMTSDNPNAHYDAGASNFGSAFSGFGDASFMFTDFAEMFTNMSSSASGNKTNATRGEDIQTEITLKFMEAIKGCEKNVRLNVKVSCTNCNGSGKKPGTNLSICKVCNGSGIQRIERGPIIIGVPCRNCSGNGQIINNPCKHCSGTGVKFQTKNITLDIPAGIKKGMQMRIPNQGHCGYRGGKSGHLFVTINIEPHPVFKWVDDNIYADVPLTIKQCLLGGLVTVPTLNGTMDILIKPKTYPNSEKVLKGKGPCKVDSHYNGDLIIKFSLKMPEKLTPRQVELIEEFNSIEMNIPYAKEGKERKETTKKETGNNNPNTKINSNASYNFMANSDAKFKAPINERSKQTTKNNNNTNNNVNNNRSNTQSNTHSGNPLHKKNDTLNDKKEDGQIPIPPSPPKQKSTTASEMKKNTASNIPIPPPPPKAKVFENKKGEKYSDTNLKGENKFVGESEKEQEVKKERSQIDKENHINEMKRKTEEQIQQMQAVQDPKNKVNATSYEKGEQVYNLGQNVSDPVSCIHDKNDEENNETYEQNKKVSNETSSISYAKKWLASKFKSKG